MSLKPETGPIFYPIRHPFDNSTDQRWAITREWTGRPQRQFVARFCGDEWIGSADTYVECEALLTTAAAAFFAGYES
jgi:hypothetical protein